MRNHPEISIDVIKQVPDLLERPIIVMASETKPNRLTMFGEVYGENGLPVMAVLELLPTKKGIALDELKVVNSYTKAPENAEPDIKYTQALINASEILYIDPNKKRTDTWLSLNRLQLPLAFTKYGPENRITLVKRDVNGLFTSESAESA